MLGSRGWSPPCPACPSMQAILGALRRWIRLGRSAPLWERDAHKSASVVITRGVVIVSDRSPNRLLVLDPASGNERGQVRSDGRVVAFDTIGFVIADRRELGYLEFSTLSQRD